MPKKKRLQRLLGSKKRLRSAAIFALVVILFLIFSRFSFFSNVTEAMQGALDSAGTGISQVIKNVFTSEDSYRAQLEREKERVRQLSIDRTKLDELEREVQELRTLVGYQSTIESKTVPAKIIARNNEDRAFVMIDKGSSNGVSEGLGVVVEDGHLIGTVAETSEHIAKVTLLSDISSKIPAKILNTEKTIGLVEGRGGFLLEMSFIPQASDVNASDIVVTSGLEGDLPGGLIIGIIEEVNRDETEPFISAFIETLVDVQNYSNVLVINPTPESL